MNDCNKKNCLLKTVFFYTWSRPSNVRVIESSLGTLFFRRALRNFSKKENQHRLRREYIERIPIKWWIKFAQLRWICILSCNRWKYSRPGESLKNTSLVRAIRMKRNLTVISDSLDDCDAVNVQLFFPVSINGFLIRVPPGDVSVWFPDWIIESPNTCASNFAVDRRISVRSKVNAFRMIPSTSAMTFGCIKYCKQQLYSATLCLETRAKETMSFIDENETMIIYIGFRFCPEMQGRHNQQSRVFHHNRRWPSRELKGRIISTISTKMFVTRNGFERNFSSK